MKNKHGVEMTFVDGHNVPAICRNCRNLEWETDGEIGGSIRYLYCIKNHWFPTRKGTCKSCKPIVVKQEIATVLSEKEKG